MIKINEIFFSIQGESSLVGQPTVFIRTTGCNLRCNYCDTKYSYYDGEFWSVESLLLKVSTFSTKYVCITGGEPLLQNEIYSLMNLLCNNGYIVSLETSGSKSCEFVDSRVKTILDVKTPSSGAKNSFDYSNLTFLYESSEVKFVITNESDFDWAEMFCREYSLFHKCQVFYSPSFNEMDPKWLAEKILATKSRARLQIQLHKYIWSPEKRGV